MKRYVKTRTGSVWPIRTPEPGVTVCGRDFSARPFREFSDDAEELCPNCMRLER